MNDPPPYSASSTSSTSNNSTDKITLQPPPIPLTINTGHATKAETELSIHCPDRMLRDVAVLSSSGTKLFSTTGPAVFPGIFTNLTYKLELKDSEGNLVSRLRFTSISSKSINIENAAGDVLCVVRDGKDRVRESTAMSAVVKGGEKGDGSVGGGDVEVRMLAGDHAGLRTRFVVQEAVVAEMVMVANNDLAGLHSKGIERSAWTLRVVEGVDLGLVVGLAVARAWVLHAFRR